MGMKDIYLILESGDIFRGKSVGAYAETTGEVVFTTGMTGYLETLTDPSYYGQIIVQTFPQIGNYGVIRADSESTGCAARAYITHEICDDPSNFRCEGRLADYLAEQGVIGMTGADTRSITKIVRERGVMNGRISFSPELGTDEKKKISAYSVKDAVAAVSCKKAYTVPAEGERKYRVALWDFGAKANIERMLAQRGCETVIMPSASTAEDILSLAPDGIMLSNGPGDPAENTEIIKQTEKLFASGVPMFGICLGHQIMALAAGAKTVKLKYGHRGANQPVRVISSGHLLITSQNHGYAVDSASIDSSKMTVSIENANDSTCEGLDYIGVPAYSVQFHPEAAAGTHDTRFLFETFMDNIRRAKENAAR